MGSWKNEKNKWPLMIAVIHFWITTVLQTDRLFFCYKEESCIILGIKVLYLIFLVCMWSFLFYVKEQYADGNQNIIRGVLIFKLYTVIIILPSLLILWPGTWAWDDLWELNAIQWFDTLFPIQHILTSTYHYILLETLPFPGGIILLQNIIISICIATIIVKLENSFHLVCLKNTYLDIFVKLLPFLLPPVMFYQFSGYRIGFYVYLEFLMLVILFCESNNGREWSKQYMLFFSAVCILVSTWRTESIFYMPFSCLALLRIQKDFLPIKKKVMCILLIVIGFFSVNTLQSYFMGNQSYTLVSLMRPCAELVRIANENGDDTLLNKIDKVIDTELICENAFVNGEELYFNYGVIRTDYSEEDYSGFISSFLKLAIKYPDVVISERTDLFIKGSGMTGDSVTNIFNSATLFDDEIERRPETMMNQNWVASTPVFEKIRKTYINFLGMNWGENNHFSLVLKKIIWNTLIPLVILLCVWGIFLFMRKWYFLLVYTPVILKIPIILMTQPSGWFMYQLSFYLLGYAFLVYVVLIILSNGNKIDAFGGASEV